MATSVKHYLTHFRVVRHSSSALLHSFSFQSKPIRKLSYAQKEHASMCLRQVRSYINYHSSQFQRVAPTDNLGLVKCVIVHFVSKPIPDFLNGVKVIIHAFADQPQAICSFDS